MDKTVCRFGPDIRLTALSGVLALVGGVLTATTGDRAGQILFGIAAAVLAAYAVTDLAYYPRIVASVDGLQIRTPGTRGAFSWPEIGDVRADSRERLGLRSTTLEIDIGDDLLVFSRRALGADPDTVAGVLGSFREPQL